MRIILLAVLLISCGGRSSPSSPGSRACPATFAAVPVGAACSSGQQCSFPEGDCTCGPESYCGGVRPTEEMLDELDKPHWQCRAHRTDGCPETAPSGGCTSDGQSCVYGDCCKIVVACESGVWVAGEKSCPP